MVGGRNVESVSKGTPDQQLWVRDIPGSPWRWNLKWQMWQLSWTLLGLWFCKDLVNADNKRSEQFTEFRVLLPSATGRWSGPLWAAGSALGISLSRIVLLVCSVAVRSRVTAATLPIATTAPAWSTTSRASGSSITAISTASGFRRL